MASDDDDNIIGSDDESNNDGMAQPFSVGPDFNDSEYADFVHDGIVWAATKWKITLPLGEVFRDFVTEGKETRWFGNICIADTTKENYEEHLKQLWRFCAIKGDYESMLLMITPTQKEAPSMRVETVEEYLRFKRQKKNKKLTRTDGKGDVLDILENVITAQNSWKNPRQAGIYRAAMKALHCQNGDSHSGHVENLVTIALMERAKL